MHPQEIDKALIETPNQHCSDDEHDVLANDRSGAEKPPARPARTPPRKNRVKKEPACVCSNCGHVVPKVENVACPPCPSCTGQMKAV